jgi:hypothetical protein
MAILVNEQMLPSRVEAGLHSDRATTDASAFPPPACRRRLARNSASAGLLGRVTHDR